MCFIWILILNDINVCCNLFAYVKNILYSYARTVDCSATGIQIIKERVNMQMVRIYAPVTLAIMCNFYNS
jgi:hypothetical protein